jgi:tetratricopeptide (TPR) repeat protein
MQSLIKVVVCIIFSVVFSVTSAQTGGLRISGFLRDGWKPVSGSLVQLYSHGALLMVAETDLSGRFDFDLELNREYQLIFGAYGYVTKRLTVDTSVRDYEVRDWIYWFNMELFPEIQEIDFSVFQLPVAKIFYSPNWGEFDFDHAYTGRLRTLSNNLVNLVKKERSSQYQKYLVLAEKESKLGNLVKAIDYYLAARVCDPYSPYPQEQINALDKMLLKKSDKYKRFLELQTLGDSCLREHAFGKASVFFGESVSLFPESEYGWYKSNLADTLHSRFDNTLFKSIRFSQNVALADKYIRARDYMNAMYHYKMASEFNPNDEYVFKQLRFLKTQVNVPDSDKTSSEYRRLIELGDKQYGRSDYEGAAKYYNQALVLNPSDQYVKIQIEKVNRKKSLFAGFSFTPESRNAKYFEDLARIYDKGISQEFHEWEGKMVLRVVINDGRDAREYLKISSSNQSKYYRNGKEITENIFRTETEH